MTASGRQIPYLSMSAAPRLPLLRQATASECGLTCIAMIASYLGAGIDLIELRRRHPQSLQGATLQNIAATCESLRLSTRAVSCRVAELRKLRTPCLLHWRFNHFVVLKSATRTGVILHDPARGIVRDTYDEVLEAFTGVAMEVTRGPEFQKARQPARLKLGGLVSLDTDIRQKLAAGLLLALICEALLLVSPFYLQVVIDQVVGQGDLSLLNMLAVGFTVLMVLQVAATVMRQLTFQYVSQVSVFDTTARVLHRLLRLPLRYFRERDLGDIQHRVQSLRRVQAFIVNSAPALIVDLLFIVLITSLMILYDPRLTLLALAVTGAWCLWRASILHISLRLSNDIASSESAVETHFLETLRAVQTVKMANGETARQSEWRNLFAVGINDKIRVGNLAVLDGALRQMLFQGLRIACIYVLAKSVLGGQMSIGMVSAFVAYLGMFIVRAGGIVDRVVEFKLLAVPLNRLADIIFNEEEPAGDDQRQTQCLRYDLHIRNAWFAHSPKERWILKDCNCRIEENSFVAIAGSSGAGKSTLLRLIAEAEPLCAGEILLGGVAVTDWPRQALRREMVVISQEDRLLKGSLAENIAVFERTIDRARVRQAAVQACIDAEIQALPMTYETRVCDLGVALSKGEAQRILLARAFYRQPRLLLLDEATSGLDAHSEKRVIDAISRLTATRIVITHSDQMLQAADRVLWLKDGVLLNSRPELNA